MLSVFFLNGPQPTEIYTLSLHDALPIFTSSLPGEGKTLTTMNLGLCYAQLPQQRVLVIDADLRTCGLTASITNTRCRSEEHTSELQSPDHLVCRLLLEKKKNKNNV